MCIFLCLFVDPLDFQIVQAPTSCSLQGYPLNTLPVQDEFRNQLLTAVLFAEQLPVCELPPEPEIEDLSATFEPLGKVWGKSFWVKT